MSKLSTVIASHLGGAGGCVHSASGATKDDATPSSAVIAGAGECQQGSQALANVEVLTNFAGLHGDGIVHRWGILVGRVHDGQDAGVEAPVYKVEGLCFTDHANTLQDFEVVKVHGDAHLSLGEVVNFIQSLLGMVMCSMVHST